MSHRLTGSWAKFDRANEHFKALNSEFARCFDADNRPLELASYFEPDTSSQLIVVARIVSLLHTGIILGDCLQNFRAALDYMVWQVVRDGGICEPTDRTQFPFTNNEQQWRSAIGDRLKGVPEPERTVIEHHQPKVYENLSAMHPMAVLAELTNQDKHRVLIPSVPWPVQISLDNVNVWRCNLVRVEPLLVTGQPLKVGTELCRVFISDVTPEHQVTMQTNFELAPSLPDGRSIKEILGAVRQRVLIALAEMERVP
jgi:hypothetical protein